MTFSLYIEKNVLKFNFVIRKWFVMDKVIHVQDPNALSLRIFSLTEIISLCHTMTSQCDAILIFLMFLGAKAPLRIAMVSPSVRVQNA